MIRLAVLKRFLSVSAATAKDRRSPKFSDYVSASVPNVFQANVDAGEAGGRKLKEFSDFLGALKRKMSYWLSMTFLALEVNVIERLNRH